MKTRSKYIRHRTAAAVGLAAAIVLSGCTAGPALVQRGPQASTHSTAQVETQAEMGSVQQPTSPLARDTPAATLTGTVWVADEEGNALTVVDASTNRY